MLRGTILSGLAAAPLALLGASAFAQDITMPVTFDEVGRPLVNVMLNGRGPFLLVLDTAASATVLAAETIAALGLAPNGMRAQMQAASGAASVDLYTLDRVELGALTRTGLVAAPLLNQPSQAGHAGVLGASMFIDTRLDLDIAGGRLRVDAGSGRAPLRGAGVVPVRFHRRTFALADVSVAGVAGTAVLDTGARRSIASPAYRAALGYSDNDARLRSVAAVGGATTDTTDARAADVAAVVFAGRDYGALELGFADLPVFGAMNLTEAPALILGVDIIHRWQGFTLDYSGAQLAVR